MRAWSRLLSLIPRVADGKSKSSDCSNSGTSVKSIECFGSKCVATKERVNCAHRSIEFYRSLFVFRVSHQRAFYATTVM